MTCNFANRFFIFGVSDGKQRDGSAKSQPFVYKKSFFKKFYLITNINMA